MEMTGPAERAHPEHEGFQRKWFKSSQPRKCLYRRYKFCNSLIKNKRVLDIPSGVGWGTSLLKGARAVFGVDICRESIEYAPCHFGKHAKFSAWHMNSLSFRDTFFDVVICLEGLEHVELQIAQAFVEKTQRVLKPDGLFIATVPLLVNGKYSENPLHLHEFEMKEAQEMLCRNFRKLLFEKFKGPDTNEIRFVEETLKT